MKNKGPKESFVSSDSSFKKQIKRNLYRQKKVSMAKRPQTCPEQRTCSQLQGTQHLFASALVKQLVSFSQVYRSASHWALRAPSRCRRNNPRFSLRARRGDAGCREERRVGSPGRRAQRDGEQDRTQQGRSWPGGSCSPSCETSARPRPRVFQTLKIIPWAPT